MVNTEARLVGSYICQTKLRYRTRKKAWENALHFFITYGTLQRAYKCNFCEKFHLSSKHVETEHLPPEFKTRFNIWYGAEVL